MLTSTESDKKGQTAQTIHYERKYVPPGGSTTYAPKYRYEDYSPYSPATVPSADEVQLFTATLVKGDRLDAPKEADATNLVKFFREAVRIALGDNIPPQTDYWISEAVAVRNKRDIPLIAVRKSLSDQLDDTLVRLTTGRTDSVRFEKRQGDDAEYFPDVPSA